MADQEKKTPLEESEQSPEEMSPLQSVTSPLSSNNSNQLADSDATSPKAPTQHQSPPTSSPSPDQATTTSGTAEQTAHQQQEQPEQQQQQQQPGTNEPAMSEPVRTLKEAFPETDVDVIEAILVSQNNSVERSFEVLLGMSDPNYKPEETPRPQQQQQQQQQSFENMQDDPPAPVMPPRPTGDQTTTQAPYGYWQGQNNQQQQQPQEPRSVEDQMRMDEEFARQLALQDEQARVQQYRQQQQRQQQQEDDQPLFNFQEDLPVIKERVIEAGTAAKKKVMDLYAQFKAGRAATPPPNQGSSMPTTNAQYRGLPSDEGDDLLAGDVSALRLSDNDVYAQTRPSEGQQQGGVIHVNPPLNRQSNPNLNVNEQIRADEELARRLAQEDQFWESSRDNNDNAPQMPPRRTTSPAIASSELEGESVTLTAAPASTQTPTPKKPEERAEERRSYVIQDEDDSDNDDLVDVDADDLQKKEDKPHEKPTTSPH